MYENGQFAIKYCFLILRNVYSSKKCVDSEMTGARLPSGLERWLALATGRCGTGSNPTADNFVSELWKFRLPRFAVVFRRRH